MQRMSLSHTAGPAAGARGAAGGGAGEGIGVTHHMKEKRRLEGAQISGLSVGSITIQSPTYGTAPPNPGAKGVSAGRGVGATRKIEM